MVARIRLGELGEAAGRCPVELAAVDDDAADDGAVAADELGRRVDDDVGAVLDRSTRYGVGSVLSRISGTPAACATSATACDIEREQIRVADRLRIDRLGLVGDRRRDRFRRSARRT